MKSAIHCLISGRVQGVCFRAATRDRALELGITGWARNLPDGRVEVRAVGDGDALARFRAWLDQGPPAARVDAIEGGEAAPADDVPDDFEIR